MNINNNENQEAVKKYLLELINEVSKQKDRIEKLLNNYRSLIQQINEKFGAEGGIHPEKFWTYKVHCDSLERLQILLNFNLSYIETLGISTLTRYIFELTVWLKLINNSQWYSLLYRHELIRNQLDHFKTLKNQLHSEIELFKKFGEKDKSFISKVTPIISEMKDAGNEDQIISFLQKKTEESRQEIDNEISKKFTINGKAACINGFDFQIYLIEKNLKQIQESIKDLQDFRNNMHTPEDFAFFLENEKLRLGDRWSWYRFAEKVDMKDEYKFVYSFTSKFLHAVPSSISTNQKNIETDEVTILLNFIRICLLEILELSEFLLNPSK